MPASVRDAEMTGTSSDEASPSDDTPRSVHAHSVLEFCLAQLGGDFDDTVGAPTCRAFAQVDRSVRQLLDLGLT